MTINRGEAVTFHLYVDDGGVSTDLDALPDVTILDPDGATSSTGSGVHAATGHYTYEHDVASNAQLGDWTIVWAGILAGDPVTANEEFEVVSAAQAPTTSVGVGVEQYDIEAILMRELTDAEEEWVTRLTEMAEGQVEALLAGFSFATGTATDEAIDVGDPTTIWTARFPVTAVTALKVDGNTVSADSYSWNDLGRIRLRSSFPLNDFEVEPFSLGGIDVTVTYAYGLDPPPIAAVHAVSAMVAAALRRGAVNPDNVQSEMLGAYQVGYGDYSVRAADAGLIPGEQVPRALRRWNRTRHLSVPLIRR